MAQFIGRRDWLARFETCLAQEHGTTWRIAGQPGIGKSTLLRRFAHMCEEAERANVWLDMEGFTPAHGLDVLKELANSARYFDVEKTGKSVKEWIGEKYKTASDGLVGALELGKGLIPGGELIAGSAKVLVAMGAGVAGDAALASEHAAAAHPEEYLLGVLGKAGGKHPVCLVDAYEHLLRADATVRSRLVFGYGSPREGNEKDVPLAGWLAGLFAYLESAGWRIVVAGRGIHGNTGDERLPRFTRDEILEAARTRPALAAYLPEREAAIGDILDRLSFGGNPLWLQVAMNLLENLLDQGEDLDQLAGQPDYLTECFETDDPQDLRKFEGFEHGRCKLRLIGTLTRHIDGLEDQAWKIALPRVLDMGIVAQLFEPTQANAIVHRFKVAGAFRPDGRQFVLHEEIRDLLLAYARSKGWLDTDATRALHGRLWEYLNETHLGKLPPELCARMNREALKEAFAASGPDGILELERQLAAYFPLNWMLDASYHRVSSLAGLAGGDVTPALLWQGLGGSASLPTLQKWQVAEALPDLDAGQVKIVAEVISNDLAMSRKLFGEATAQALRQAQLAGHPDVIRDIAFWEARIRDHGLPGDYFGFQDILAAFHADTHVERRVAVIDEMLSRYGGATDKEVAVQCAKALVNKGWTLGNRLDDPRGAVAVYDALLARYGASTHAEVDVQCAKALFNKGVTLGERLDDPCGAVAVYDALLARYGASPHAEVEAQCAQALFNKGVTLGERLDDPRGAVAVYDGLLARYGESTHAEVEVQCAQALLNKGVTLGNRLDGPHGAVVVYDALLARYGESTHAEVEALCAQALLNKGVTLGDRLDDPRGEVAVYDALLARYGASTHAEVEAQCAKAQYNKGWTLSERLDDPHGAVAVYDALLARYGASTHAEVEAQCAKALVDKGVTLGNRLGDPRGAVAAYDALLSRYSSSDDPEVRRICLDALANQVELLLVLGEREAAIRRIEAVLEQVDERDQTFAIMTFLRWLAEEGGAPDGVLSAIRALAPEVTFTWGWDEIRPLVAGLPEPRRAQAACFIAFFEGQLDMDGLAGCLGGGAE